MPTRDGTGPMGFGPATGRGLGPCGRGFAFGRGCGRDFGRRAFGQGFGWRTGPAELSKEEKVKMLKAEKDSIEKALKELGE